MPDSKNRVELKEKLRSWAEKHKAAGGAGTCYYLHGLTIQCAQWNSETRLMEDLSQTATNHSQEPYSHSLPVIQMQLVEIEKQELWVCSLNHTELYKYEGNFDLLLKTGHLRPVGDLLSSEALRFSHIKHMIVDR